MRCSDPPGRLALLALLLMLPRMAAAQEVARPAVEFGRDIRPILSNYCFRCHGPDEQQREAELRLDRVDDATRDRGGWKAIEPGNAAASRMMQRILTHDPDQKMPPESSGLKLSERDIQLLSQWIQQGAEYQLHWSFRPILRPAEPATDSDWPVNAIDRFILARLAEHQIEPSPEAARPTLIRRVHLDVTGLPPSIEEVELFESDAAPGAVARMIDRALASPHYGERWGRHWLDQARYADTNGYTIDSERSLWPFRDWVIRALNSDMPFDQFTIEQLAGDLLPSPTLDQRVASGFHRNTLINEEGGTDDEQFRNEAVVDRVNTTGAVWLGLTVGCAQCHTHKYDPLSHREYYQLFAFFNQGQDVNTTNPTVRVPSAEQAAQLAEAEQRVEEARDAVAQYDQQRQAARAAAVASGDPAAIQLGQPVVWTPVTVDSITSIGGTLFEKLEDQSILASADNMITDRYTITFQLPALTPSRPLTGLRLETLTHPSLPAGGPGRADDGNFILNELTLAVQSPDGSAENVQAAKWVHATADHSQRDFSVADAVDGKPATGWSINVESGSLNVSRTATFVMSELKVEAGSRIVVEMHFGPKTPAHNLGRFRLSVTDAEHEQLDVPDPERARLLAIQKSLEDQRKALTATIPTTLVMADLAQPRTTHVLLRGDFLRPGDVVQPNVPAVFPSLAGFTPEDAAAHATADGTSGDRRPSRLDLARWLTDPRHPLTARVTVNRVWARYFGRGLVETENDFGLQGTPPTHPELLDWLAAEFIEQRWSMKQLHRLILNSATYRQSSHQRPELLQVDPLNKLLARQTRLRVDAEIVRDLGLAVSGILNPKIGGPSVYPPQPSGVYAFTQRNAAWPVSQGADRWRRGMYTFFMRSAPFPMLTTFDTPRFDTTCTMRIRSNTPLQSLALSNDETMIEIARALGRRIQALGADDAGRIRQAFRLCFARPATSAEVGRLEGFLQLVRAEFLKAPADAVQFVGLAAEPTVDDGGNAAEAAAWAMLARTLINLDEFIVRE